LLFVNCLLVSSITNLPHPLSFLENHAAERSIYIPSPEDIKPLGFTLSTQAKSLIAQAKWFLYHKQKIALRSFNDPYFHRIVLTQATSYILQACDNSKQLPHPLLSIYKLRRYSNSGYSIFILLLQLIIKLKVQEIRAHLSLGHFKIV